MGDSEAVSQDTSSRSRALSSSMAVKSPIDSLPSVVCVAFDEKSPVSCLVPRVREAMSHCLLRSAQIDCPSRGELAGISRQWRLLVVLSCA